MEKDLFNGSPQDSYLAGASPHIADYWQVIARRLWLVMLIFGVTTTAAIWAVSQQLTIYETRSSIQINDRRGELLHAVLLTGTTPRSVRRDGRS